MKTLKKDLIVTLLIAIALVCVGYAGWKVMKFLCEDVPCHVQRP